MPASLSEMEYDEVSLVDSGANQDAHVVLFKRDFSADQRKKAAKEGHTVPGTESFPINNTQDLKNAIRSVGRAKDPAKAKAFIISRAKDLGALSLLPDGWQVSKSGKKRLSKKNEGVMADVVKRKMSCADCGKVMSSGMDACPECGSDKVKKSLVVVRKSEEEIDIDSLPEVTDETVDEADDENEEGVVEEEDDESGEDDDQEDEDEEEESDDESEPPTPVEVPEEVVGKASEETLDLTYALTKSIRDILSDATVNKADAYEQVMVEFNSALDQAAEHWFAGSYVSKSATPSAERVARLTEMHEELSSIIGKKEGGTVTGLSDEVRKGLDNDVLAYIADLENKAGVSKSEDDEIFKGMSPAAVEIVKNAQKAADEAKAELAKRDDEAKTAAYIAKAAGYTHLPVGGEDLGTIMKSVAGALSAEEYGKFESLLDATNYNLAQSNVFKNFGTSRNGAEGSTIAKMHAEADVLVKSGQFPTIEQAEAHLMRTNPSLYDNAVAEGGVR